VRNPHQKAPVVTSDPAVLFFYLLLRGVTCADQVEEILARIEGAIYEGGADKFTLANHHLAKYAQELSTRLSIAEDAMLALPKEEP